MAQVGTIEDRHVSSQVQFSTRGERVLRQAGAWLLLYFTIQGAVGLSWDILWHGSVGRDSFWTPPHILIYTGVALSGLIALSIVLVDSLRYRRHVPGVDDDSTFAVLRIFHAPLGFIVAGFGSLTLLIAAPLDNYWHELYGIDVALWAPFHMMGLIGATITTAGVVYCFASEAALARQRSTPPRTYAGFTAMEWGALVALSSLLGMTQVIAQPALAQYPTLDLGDFRFLNFPIILTLGAAFILMAASRFTQKPWAATVVALILLARAVPVMYFTTYAVRFAAQQEGLAFRTGHPPAINWFSLATPLIFLLAALVVDLLAFRALSRGLASFAQTSFALLTGIALTIPIMLVGIPYVRRAAQTAQGSDLVPAGVIIPLPPKFIAGIYAIPLVLLVGAFMGSLGVMVGDIWRRSTR